MEDSFELLEEKVRKAADVVRKLRNENKALEYTLIQEDVQRARSVAGACVVLPEPRLVCVDRRCRAVSEQ